MTIRITTLAERPDLADSLWQMPHAELPDDGWDAVVRWGADTRRRGARSTAISALDITIRTDLLGGGMSGRMLAAMREDAVYVEPNVWVSHPL
ncbi:hypothetical protein [Nonomuraea roseola]|uniref:GNAT family N-acetyltransferase n=1 Tax=Nonomuraea roseola TaxID=46179 RepID=A0ABV5PQ24_9ACTN